MSKPQRNGQILAEILIGITVAGVLLGAGSYGIVAWLQADKKNRDLQAASDLAAALMENAKTFADSNWNGLPGAGGAHLSSVHYYFNIGSSPFSFLQGEEIIAVNGTNFVRYYYLEDVTRDTNGNITTSGGSVDPSTLKVSVEVCTKDPSAAAAPYCGANKALIVYSQYLTRATNGVLWQTDWSGGNGQENFPTSSDGVIVNNKYSAQQNIDAKAIPGSLKIQGINSYLVSGRTDVTQNNSDMGIGPGGFSTAIDSRTGILYVAYVSNEYNSVPNIALRNSANFGNRVDVTANVLNLDPKYPQIAIGSDGIVRIAYKSKEFNSSVYNIAYRDSSNWSNRIDYTTNATINSDNPVVAVDSGGIFHIAYSSYEVNATVQNIAYRNSANKANRIDVTNTSVGMGAYDPRIAVGSNGIVHIVYESNEYSNPTFNIAYRNSSSWPNRVDVTANTNGSTYVVSVAVDSNGVVRLAYQSQEFNSIVYNIAYRNSSNWSNRINITTNTTPNSYNPSMGVTNGSVNIVYISQEYNNSVYNIAYRNSSNWSNRTDVTSDSGGLIGAYAPSMAMDSNGVVYAVYLSKEYNTAGLNLAYRTITIR